MQQNQNWNDAFTTFRTEMQKNMKGMSEDVKQAMHTAKTDVVKELNHVEWAKQIFLDGNQKARQGLVMTRTDLDTRKIVQNTENFVSDMVVDTWKKVDALPTNKTPLAIYGVKWNFVMDLYGHHTEKTVLLTNMVVYDGYVQLEILDGMTKHLRFLIPKEKFFVFYETGNDVTNILTAFGV